ncbi:TonB-dependent receptor [candidate division KSB1 bacterium]|nr:TonB-dependent receptor [candidate division KSB1 bacterium]
MKTKCISVVFSSIMFFFFLFTQFLMAATTGNISGKITDAATGEPLPGANVILKGTSLGSATNLQGEYRIVNVPPGRYTIIFSYIGYEKDEEEILVAVGQSIKKDMALKFEIVEGEVVIVSAQREGQMAAINQQLRSNTIVNVVSKERINELPDNNAAESVGRLPGIAVRRSGGEGTRVNIRGLSPKFNSITVDGEQIPATGQGRDLFSIKGSGPGSASTLTDDRSVDLSMMSSEALGGIEVFKALTPDKDADAIGGAVNFVTSKAPEGLRARLNLLGGYTGYHQSYNNLKVNATVSNRYLDNKLGVLFSGAFQRADRSADRQTVNWIWQGKVVINGLDLDDVQETRDRYNVNLNLDYNLGENSNISLTSMYNRSNREVMNRSMNLSIRTNNADYGSNWSKPAIYFYSTNLRGVHQTPLVEIDWGLNYIATFDENDFSYGYGFQDPGIFQSLNFVEEEGPAAASNNATYDLDAWGGVPHGGGQSAREDKNWSGVLNLKRPFTITSTISGYIKAGGKIRSKDRNYESSGLKVRGTDFLNRYIADHPEIKVVRVNDLAMSNFLGAYNPGDFFDGQHPFIVTLDAKRPSDMFNAYRSMWREQVADGMGNYTARENISSGYLMGELSYLQRITLLGGARYERTKNDYKAIWRTDIIEDFYDETVADLQGSFRDTTSIHTVSAWYPQVHLKIGILQNTERGRGLDLRIATTKTLSRPDYLMLSPKYYISATKSLIERGNPKLKFTTAWNYDLFLTGYSRLGLITIGGFYKELEDVAFLYSRKARPAIDGVADRYTIVDPQNSKDLTKVKGLEFELQTNFKWLPSPFDGIVLYGNYSMIRSEAHYPWTYVKYDPKTYKTIRIDSTRTNQLPGQANNIFNISLGYDKGRFSGRISYYQQDKILDWIGENEELDGWIDEYDRIDLSASFIVTQKIKLILNVNNLNNRHDRSFQGINNLVNSESIFGTQAEFGIRYDF